MVSTLFGGFKASTVRSAQMNSPVWHVQAVAPAAWGRIRCVCRSMASQRKLLTCPKADVSLVIRPSLSRA